MIPKSGNRFSDKIMRKTSNPYAARAASGIATTWALASHSRAKVSSTLASAAGNVAANRLARSACINHVSSSLFIGIANRAPLTSLKLPIRRRITILVF